MKRETTKFVIPPSSIGTRSTVLLHDYFPNESVKNMDRNSLEWYGQERVYIQASLHADELPGLLVSHHLIKLLDKAAEAGAIKKHIVIVPYANPIGLNQILQGKHLGRFSLSSGTNFNRSWLDVTDKVAKSVEKNLDEKDKEKNTPLIRKALFDEASAIQSNSSEVIWKKELFKKACISSVVIDLHCDSDAVMHMYTHERSWPAMADLASALDSKCNLIAPESGGNPFDEAFSCPWAKLMDRFGDSAVEMACQSATVELRGECDVSGSVSYIF
jgi:predicted deacylase